MSLGGRNAMNASACPVIGKIWLVSSVSACLFLIDTRCKLAYNTSYNSETSVGAADISSLFVPVLTTLIFAYPLEISPLKGALIKVIN